MLFSESRSLTTGSDRRDHFRTVLIAIGLFVCSAGFLSVVKWFDLTIFHFLRLEYFAIGLLVGSEVLAANDHSLRRVWIFSFALAAGFGIHLAGMGITGEMPGLPFRILWAISVGSVVAAVLGTLGGLLGMGLFRLSTNVP
ncbi:hypothetical protein ACFFQF_24070 [Haladaptatus pallidirubidus]|uniref:Uncharacterized protein n=1 Tax=Haladaptatus pallidirubidus TaxID=1008152 RepID=A0AAV3UIW5_9EURY|nr:hypothetical protein [Haladaptatus pallidirubidus]